MDTQLVFIAGIHGVGKSTFCSNFKARYGNLDSFSASSLIKKYKSNAFTTSKQVSDIDSNQDILINALAAQKSTKDLVLLDGHFCLFDSEFIPQEIPADVFIKLDMDIIILLTAPVELIIERMKSRDGKQHSFEQLSKLQSLELEVAQKIAKRLNIPLFIFSHDQVSENIEACISETIQRLQQ